MPLSMMLMVSVILAVAAAMQCFATLTFRPGIFFGVTVDREFRQSENAHRIVWRYRRPILVMAVLCAAALWIVVPRLNGLAAFWRASACAPLRNRIPPSAPHLSYPGTGHCLAAFFRLPAR
jgi:hypothetical protein